MLTCPANKETIDVFDAGVIASKHKIGSVECYKRIVKFIELFEESGRDEHHEFPSPMIFLSPWVAISN